MREREWHGGGGVVQHLSRRQEAAGLPYVFGARFFVLCVCIVLPAKLGRSAWHVPATTAIICRSILRIYNIMRGHLQTVSFIF